MGMLLKRRPKVSLTTSASLNGGVEETPIVEKDMVEKKSSTETTKRSSKKKGE